MDAGVHPSYHPVMTELSAHDVAHASGRAVDDPLVVAALRDARTYLAADPAFDGDAARLASALIHNRATGASPVDPAVDRRLTQAALGRLSPECRDLLRVAVAAPAEPPDTATRHRRAVCLRRVKAYLVERRHGEDHALRCLDPRLGADLWRLDDPATAAATRQRLDHHLAHCHSCRQQRHVEAAVLGGLRDGRFRLNWATRWRLHIYRGIATAGAIALGVGLLLLFVLPPRTPLVQRTVPRILRPVPGEVVLGSRARLVWSAIPGATGYEVIVRDAAGEVVWRTRTDKTRAALTLPRNQRCLAQVTTGGARLERSFQAAGAGGFVVYRLSAGEPVARIAAAVGLLAAAVFGFLGRPRRDLGSAFSDWL
jgi:hypothetical protein